MMNTNEATLTVDARGLDPPQPLVVILEALTSLPEGAEMRASIRDILVQTKKDLPAYWRL